MSPSPETLAQLVERVLPTKYDTLRDADRETGVPYGTWQNILLRGTVPTLETLEKVADALGVPELDILNAARASRAARAQAKSELDVEAAKPIVSHRRSKRDTQRGTGSTGRDPRSK